MIKIGNIQIFSYVDDSTHDDIYLLHVGETLIKKYTIPYDAKDWQKKHEEILGDCIKTLWDDNNADPEWKPKKELIQCSCAEGWKMKIEDNKLLCAYCGKEIEKIIKV